MHRNHPSGDTMGRPPGDDRYNYRVNEDKQNAVDLDAIQRKASLEFPLRKKSSVKSYAGKQVDPNDPIAIREMMSDIGGIPLALILVVGGALTCLLISLSIWGVVFAYSTVGLNTLHKDIHAVALEQVFNALGNMAIKSFFGVHSLAEGVRQFLRRGGSLSDYASIQAIMFPLAQEFAPSMYMGFHHNGDFICYSRVGVNFTSYQLIRNTVSGNLEQDDWIIDDVGRPVRFAGTKRDYDPRVRGWFKKSTALKYAVFSDVYAFTNRTPALGITPTIPLFRDLEPPVFFPSAAPNFVKSRAPVVPPLAFRTPIAIFAADITLEILSEFLEAVPAGLTGQLFCLDHRAGSALKSVITIILIASGVVGVALFTLTGVYVAGDMSGGTSSTTANNGGETTMPAITTTGPGGVTNPPPITTTTMSVATTAPGGGTIATTTGPPLPTGSNIFQLPPTVQGKLLVVELGNRANGKPRVVARSYDNSAWEALDDQDFAPLEVTCRTDKSDECALVGGSGWTVREIPVPDHMKNLAPAARVARLLSQATFGYTKADLDAATTAYQNDLAAWVRNEMSKPPALLREYVRRRTNPRTSTETNPIASALRFCDVGARYRKVTSGGTSTNTRNVADNDMNLVELQGRGHFAIDSYNNCQDNNAITHLRWKNELYSHQPRIRLLDNTLGDPAGSQANAMCPTLVRNFVNRDTCVRRSSCGAPPIGNAELTLDEATLRRWFTGSQRYVYYVDKLRLNTPFDVSPCAGPSRWQITQGTCTSPTPGLDQATRDTLSNALRSSADTNLFVRDIELPGGGCTAAPGVTLQVDATCYQHVHPDSFSVRDFTVWGATNLHPGNAVSNPNPIFKWADQGGVALVFPTSHPMSRYVEENMKHIPYVGRYGDKVDFQALSTALQTTDMATFAGASLPDSTGSYESCGSPGETANDGRLGHRYIWDHDDIDSNEQYAQLDWRYELRTGKGMAWLNHVLKAPDQLRQRAAWALAQIVTIGDNDALHVDQVEIWATYYDIFVRHAFGNYRDILKEVSYHPVMAEYLTYLGSRSFQSRRSYPDENYAREIMQLFTVGLYKHGEDGRKERVNGDYVDTYTDADIVDFARVWTGFDQQQPRSNIEDHRGRRSNYLDPMQIKPAWRDYLPKAKLDKGYLGDGYPLCSELPPQPFLRQGARFIYHGASSIEGTEFDGQAQGTFRNRGRFQPPADSALFNVLCGVRTPNGGCTFPSEVTLTNSLPCTGPLECAAEDVVSVMIVNGAQTGYYTYVRPPCVSLTFFENGRLLQYGNNYQCGNPARPLGTPTCCEVARPERVASNLDTAGMCLFGNELVTWQTQKTRCEAAGLVMCERRQWRPYSWTTACTKDQWQWFNAPCHLQVQVHGTGLINLVDPKGNNVGYLAESNGNFFRVRWANSQYPAAAATGGCGSECRQVDISTGQTCVCNVTVSTTAVFTTTVPTLAEANDRLAIGAAPISSFDAGTYSLCTTTDCTKDSNVQVWIKTGSVWSDDSTIFELPPSHFGRPRRFMMNRESRVSVPGRQMSFRNPPAFMPVYGEWPTRSLAWRPPELLLQRAELEVDALLDHLFYHRNTPAFVAYRLCQRMVTSNPSLRYVKAVADAFRTGTYAGRVFSGRYGDLAASFTAVLMDPEARSSTVEAEPSFGQFREPLLKFISLMRGMQLTTKDGREVAMPRSIDKIGQEGFKQPSVFGFYLPEYRSAGPVEDSGLVAPEAQIATTPRLVNYFNGMTSLIDYGLTNCGRGLGYSRLNDGSRRCGDTARNRETSDGFLSHVPSGGSPEAVVDELNLLLTAGRMAPSTRDLVVGQYRQVLQASNAEAALRRALKVIISSTEFHTNNGNILRNQLRPASVAPSQGAGREYKAIVVIFLGGGADSYNLVVPHSNCGKDYYAEYQEVRTGAAIDKAQLLPIDVPAGQPCTRFGVHPQMTAAHRLYTEGDAAFFVDIGGLIEPISVEDYRRTSGVPKQIPPSPTAHNIAQRSMHNGHAQNSNAKGILGRAVDALKRLASPFAASMYSIAGNAKILQADVAQSSIIDQRTGVLRISQDTEMYPLIENITRFHNDNHFAETYQSIVKNTVFETERLGTLLDTVDVPTFGNAGLNRQMHQVAKLIKLRSQLSAERDVFFTSQGGWDTHNSFSPPWDRVNDPLDKFQAEMKAQGVWDNVAVVTISDFGRTLKSNGAGTDHQWSNGAMLFAGGGIKGGRFFGKYPDTLRDDGEFHFGSRGRIIPRLGWESMWKGIVEWFGVTNPADLDKVLPNLKNFPPDLVFDANELFN